MNIINKIKAFLADENGAETVEWVVVCAGITALAVAIYSSTATGTVNLKIAVEDAMSKVTAAVGKM